MTHVSISLSGTTVSGVVAVELEELTQRLLRTVDGAAFHFVDGRTVIVPVSALIQLKKVN